MTRLLALVGIAGGALAALLVWLSSRDLREPWVVPPMPDPDDDMAGIQPADPVTVQVHHHPVCNKGCFDGWHHLGPEAGPYAVAYPIPGT